MQAPLDYPIIDSPNLSVATADDLTYAALLDRHESEQLITDEMIKQACLRMEAAQQFPFATKASPKPFAALNTIRDSGHSSSAVTSRTERMRQYWKRTIG